jgi:hypothetical protein
VTRTRCLLGALALVLMLSSPASAGVEVGSEAPDFGAGGQFNSEPVKLSELKGRLILLELFSTT